METNTNKEREVSRVVPAPAPEPGFLGRGHTAVEVLGGESWATRNPFVHLMDDRIDFGPGTHPVGEAHPHAGLETVTLMLEGGLHDRDEGDLNPGDVVWMTAGRGIIHSEHMELTGRARALQLWIRLPERHRNAAPDFTVLRGDAVPTLRAKGVEARLYSGQLGALRSPTRNYVPVTLAELRLAPGAELAEAVPARQAGFLYAIEGTAAVAGARVAAGELAWLDTEPDAGSVLRVQAGSQGARLILYLGEPVEEPFVTRGPFVAGSEREISRMYHAYLAGSFTRMSDLARARKGAA